MKSAPVPEVYGAPVVYVCVCRSAHGVVHLCALCRTTSGYRPSEPWVEAERCRTCLVEERERLETQLAVVDRKLRRAVHAIDGTTGKRIPPHFLTAERLGAVSAEQPDLDGAFVSHQTDRAFPLTDLGNAERLVAEHGRDLRFVPGLGWFAWDGRRWKRDNDGAAIRRAKQSVRTLYRKAGELESLDERKKVTAWAIASESEARLRASVKLAETERAVIVEPRELDADPWLFNAANGTIDLRTGVLREHRRDDLLTRITRAFFDNLAEHELWDASLRRATGDDAELAGFLRRAVGYSLTGHTHEDKLFFAHGPTATAKSSLLEAIKAALGEYAATADFETFLKRRGDAGIRNDIARLDGARIVLSIEVDEGKALAEGLVKLLTGGDTVAARFLYHETFEFQPRFKLWLAANARPRVSADDDAIWRRIVQVPFVCVIPEAERDERIKIELRTQPQVLSAILTWAVRGCIEWQEKGLAVPESVRDYTDEYRAENDPLRDWLADCCELDAGAWTSNADLRRSYEAWCEDNGEKPLTAKKFGTLLEARGIRTQKLGGDRGRRAIRVR